MIDGGGVIEVESLEPHPDRMVTLLSGYLAGCEAEDYVKATLYVQYGKF